MLAKKRFIPRVSHLNIVNEPDSGIQEFKNRLENAVDLAMEKALAHTAESGKYPLPQSARSLERVLAGFIEKLPRSARKDAIDKFMPRIKASAKDREALYGPLKAVNLRSSASIMDQIKSIPLPPIIPSQALVGKVRRLVLDDDGRRRGEDGNGGGNAGSGGASGSELHKLELRLRRLECVDKTNWELGKDEIRIMGTSSDGIGNVKTIKPIDLGKYKKGTDTSFNPLKIFASIGTQGPDLPFRSFDADLILFEKDLAVSDPDKILDSTIDGVTDFLKEPVTKFVLDVLKEGLKGALAGTIAGAAAGLKGMIIGALVGFTIGILGGVAKKAFGHEIFDPVNVNLTLGSLTQTIDEDFITDTETAAFSKFGGIYKLSYDWRLIP